MIASQTFFGQKIAVLGLGRSGVCLAKAIEAGKGQALCWDDDAPTRARASAQGLSLCDLTKAPAFEGVERLVVSPGVAHLYPAPHPAVQHALEQAIPLDNDIGLFFDYFRRQDWDEFDVMPKVIGITGSNGKSTVTALIGHLLGEAGRPHQIGGNFGRAVFDLAPPQSGEIIVLELSSYQCELARALSPDIAVFTNFSHDHTERHGGRGGCFAAKARLFHQGAPERAIIGIDEKEGAFLKNQCALYARDECVLPVSTQKKPAHADRFFFVKKGFLSEYRKGTQIGMWDLREIPALQGAHNHQNAAHGVAVARSLGIAPRVIEKALASFEGLAHRCQYVGERGGVRFINDSKATNGASAVSALKMFDKVRWIAGGRAKEDGLTDVLPYLDRVIKAYLIGEAADDFSQTLGVHAHEVSGTLEKAVENAAREAQAGETVLLSPAAASWDQFESFEARGETFIRLAKKQKI